jgi:molybdate transport system substrate-binding protein
VWAGEVHVAAAASLKEVLNEIADGYVKQHAGVKIIRYFGASGVIAKQIENGLDADVFISANAEWITYLQNQSLLDTHYRSTLAYNTLVVVGTKATKLQSFTDLTRLEKIAIGSPQSVPAGEYAQQAFTAAGISDTVKDKLILAKDVRDALKYAELGEVDAALVYATDARLSSTVSLLLVVPPADYTRIAYPAGLTVVGAKNAEAIDFFTYLQTPAAKAILTHHGFSVP